MKTFVLYRQQIRAAALLVSFMLFPVTMFYFSPYIPLDGATQGIVNASLIVFGLMFVAALVVGRLYCGWLCPGAGQMEAAFAINDKPANRKLRWIKWAIWIPWLGAIATLAIASGGYHTVDPFFHIEGGVSLVRPAAYIVYFVVTGLTFALSVLAGKRGFCHTACWMAPFMILGRKAGNALRLPGLRLRVTDTACVSCHRCDRHCPMSLPVSRMVETGNMESSDCILCGNCIDACRRKVIAYEFGRPGQARVKGAAADAVSLRG